MTCLVLSAGVSVWLYHFKQTVSKLLHSIGPVCTIVLLAINLSVDTERETLTRWVQKLTHQLQSRGIPGIIPLLDPSYSHAQVTFADIKKASQSHLKRWSFTSVQASKWTYKKKGSSIYMECTLRAHLQWAGRPQALDPSTWGFHLRKDALSPKWMIHRITPIALTLPYGSVPSMQLRLLLNYGQREDSL